MNLPNLPRQYNRKEAKIDSKVGQWFLDNYDGDVAIEVKVKGGKVLEHQQIALDQVNDGSFYYKIPDTGRRNPFDLVILKKAEGFVVTCDGNTCEAVGRYKQFKFKI